MSHMLDFDFGSIHVGVSLLPNGEISHALTLVRPENIDALSALGEAMLDSFLTERLVAPGRLLPEVVEYEKIKGKDPGIDSTVARIKLERDKLKVDRQIALHDQKGDEKYLTTLAKFDEELKKIDERMDLCERGRTEFTREKQRLRQAAETALEAFYHIAMALVIDEAQKKVDGARAEVAAIGTDSELPFRTVLEAIDRFFVVTRVVERLRLFGDLSTTFVGAVLNGSKLNLIASAASRRAGTPGSVLSGPGENVLLRPDAPGNRGRNVAADPGYNVTVAQSPGRNVSLDLQ